MTDLIVWMIAFTIGISVTVLSAAAGNYDLHLGVTAVVTLTIAIVAVQTHRKLMTRKAHRSALAASTSRYIGLVWIWAACALLVTYEFILTWRESWLFVAGLLIVGALCLGLAHMFDRDGDADKHDETMLSLGRTLNTLQVFGMLIAVAGLVADGKFGPAARGAMKPDWAANNIFFFGAIAVALIGAHALIAEKKLAQARP